MSKQAALFAAEFKEIRKKLDLNQNQMAEKLGIKRPRLGSYEEGRAVPNLVVFLKLCKLNGKDPLGYLDKLEESETSEDS